jgi:hypothetical protein
MGSMSDDFDTAKMLYPHLPVDHIVEGISFCAKNGTSLKEYAAKVATETEQLNRLERALSLFEVATMLMDLTSPEIVGTAVKRIQHKNEGTIGAEIQRAEMANYEQESEMDIELENELLACADADDAEGLDEILEKIKHNRMVRLGLHKTPVSDSRSPLQATSRKFKKLVASQGTDDADIRRMAAQNSHVSEDERTIDFEGSTELNEGATFLLRQKIAQREKDEDDEGNRRRHRNQTVARVHSRVQEATAASRTIETHYKADPRIGEVANKIEVQNVANAGAVQDMAAIKWIKDVDTRDALRGTEFAQINVTQDNSFAARVARKEAEAAAITKAAESISRPSQIDFKDNYLNDQGNVGYNRPEAKANIDKTKNYVGPDGKHNFPNKEKNWDVSLSNPKKPIQNNDPFSSYTGAI